MKNLTLPQAADAHNPHSVCRLDIEVLGGDGYRSSLRYASVLNFPYRADRSRHARIALACFG